MSWNNCVCFVERCPPPPVIAFADVMVHNNIALYSCQNGHRPISGSSLINCSKSNWQATTFSCYGKIPFKTHHHHHHHHHHLFQKCRHNYILIHKILSFSFILWRSADNTKCRRACAWWRCYVCLSLWICCNSCRQQYKLCIRHLVTHHFSMFKYEFLFNPINIQIRFSFLL